MKKNAVILSTDGAISPGLRMTTHPNFPSYRLKGFTVELENSPEVETERIFPPLRLHTESGRGLNPWELCVRTSAGSLAGGCAVALPPGRGDSPSPRQVPHPVLGHWLSALRYTGLEWLECGTLAVAPGFSEEDVLEILWEGLGRLMRRNGIGFLVGSAPVDSLTLQEAMRRGGKILEPVDGEERRYFLYTRP